MTFTKNSLLLIGFLFCLAYKPLHHGWANYDQDKVLDYTGTIQKSTYENPHTTAIIKQGRKNWTVILAPVSRMQARGVTADMLKTGASVQVVGYPHKKIRSEMRAERIFIDGNKYELR